MKRTTITQSHRLILLLLLCMEVSLGLHAHTVTDQWGFKYEINRTEGTAKMTYVNKNNGNLTSAVNLVIDSVAYNGKNYPVTEMGQYAFGWIMIRYYVQILRH